MQFTIICDTMLLVLLHSFFCSADLHVFPLASGTLSKTMPSTGRGGQFFQLISLSPGNTYQLKNWPPRRVESVVLLKVSIIFSVKLENQVNNTASPEYTKQWKANMQDAYKIVNENAKQVSSRKASSSVLQSYCVVIND